MHGISLIEKDVSVDECVHVRKNKSHQLVHFCGLNSLGLFPMYSKEPVVLRCSAESDLCA